jgi:putative hydrolase of the HAD superfamily
MHPIWLFDLDNTLHNASPHIFPHINRSMTAYLMRHLDLDERDANRLRMDYWKRYGATLTGLMRHHGTRPAALPPRHPPVSRPGADGGVRQCRAPPAAPPARQEDRLLQRPQLHYAEAVLDVMGIRKLFADVYSVEQMRFHPKPKVAGFQHLIKDHRLNPRRCILVEDSAENLRTAKRLGMKTVWISRSLRQPHFVDCQLPSVLGLARHAIRKHRFGVKWWITHFQTA